jgi:SARP family transcriptional regulator, regulator of embCAB operon
MSSQVGCQLQVCGPLVVCMDGRDVTPLLPLGQARTLLVYLVLRRYRSLARADLVDALWGHDPPPRAERDLAALLSRLRHVLGADVLPTGGHIRLVLPDHAEVDIEVAAAALARAEAAPASGDWQAAADLGAVALGIARRGILPDVAQPWADRERARLRDLVLRSYDVIGEAGLRLGGPHLGASQRMGMEIVAEEPIRESGYRLAMRASVAQGNPAEALRIYDLMRRSLAGELGVDPGPESRTLFQEILGRSSLRPEA